MEETSKLHKNLHTTHMTRNMGTGSNITCSWMGVLLLPEAALTRTTENYNRMIIQYILLLFWLDRGSLKGNVSQKRK